MKKKDKVWCAQPSFIFVSLDSTGISLERHKRLAYSVPNETPDDQWLYLQQVH